eukprot:TRINITY_DN4553_c0_g1_i7.p2 TRINITY_DN4553_c0_g1~~TRINITY_DN4553_c0_g1_i7.p2  ORF type:complete len:179 (+),score=18.51 TRINITY_DN4553_c0_g1_i7:188-724(+)
MGKRKMKEEKKLTRKEAEDRMRKTKMDKSSPFFKNTRVMSCTHVVMNHGEAVAVAFPQKKTGYKAVGSYGNMSKSSEKKSLSHVAHSQGIFMHVGMPKKPLVPYHPNSYRNRLPISNVVMPHKNSSQVVIGDRMNANKKQYVSTNNNVYTAHSLHDGCTNPGILAEATLRTHKAQLHQ